MLSRQALQEYLEPLKPDQIEAITSIRRLIFEHNPSATEEIDEGKWFGGLLTYNTPAGHFLYALGPRKDGSTTFHMMPYYSLPDLQTRHSEALKRFLTGKSCIKFKRFSDLPESAIVEIVASTPVYEIVAEEYLKSRAQKTKRRSAPASQE